MRSHLERVWKAAPLPPAFHLALETGNWQKALFIYQRHPFHAPPADTFDLLKSMMHFTGVGVNDVKNRFNEKIRLSVILQRKTVEEVEWGVFWDALNKGDGKTISAALLGAHISQSAKQIAVAESCAVLLRNAGPQWYERLVENMPFAVVTRSNLVHAALSEERWDVAVEILRNVRLTKTDVMALWPLMTKFTWEQVLQIISACPKNSIPYDVSLLFILRKGCNLQYLSEHLEQARVLGDVDVVAPLLTYAIEIEDWSYVQRVMAHLVDIGQITPTTCKAFERLCTLHSYKTVCRILMEHNVQMVHLTVENLEALKLETTSVVQFLLKKY